MLSYLVGAEIVRRDQPDCRRAFAGKRSPLRATTKIKNLTFAFAEIYDDNLEKENGLGTER